MVSGLVDTVGAADLGPILRGGWQSPGSGSDALNLAIAVHITRRVYGRPRNFRIWAILGISYFFDVQIVSMVSLSCRAGNWIRGGRVFEIC